MSEERKIEYVEDRVPLEAIDDTVSEVIDTYGGVITSRGEGSVDFDLPRRRGVPASGSVACALSWKRDNETEGTITLTSGEEMTAPRPQRIALLAMGVIGALLWTVWPFFPNMGPVAWVGGALAIAAYLLTIKKTPRGIVWGMLQRIAEIQRVRAMQAAEATEDSE